MAAISNLEERHWLFGGDEGELDAGSVIEFRLVYQGELLSSGNKNTRSLHKHFIRRYFHKQLERLWRLNPELDSLAEWMPANKRSVTRVPRESRASYIRELADKHKIGETRYVPLVTEAMRLTYAVDIMLLRRADPKSIYTSGDLDGKIKTLMDALRMPKQDEFREGPEDPLFCLAEDDKLMTELKLQGDLLLPPEDQLALPDTTGLSQNHALAILFVTVKARQVTPVNMAFL